MVDHQSGRPPGDDELRENVEGAVASIFRMTMRLFRTNNLSAILQFASLPILGAVLGGNALLFLGYGVVVIALYAGLLVYLWAHNPSTT